MAARQLKKALTFLGDYLRERTTAGTITCEGTPVLASRAGVSRTTMIKAVRLLQQQQILTGKNGVYCTIHPERLYLLCTAQIDAWTSTPRIHKETHLTEAVKNDVLNGRIERNRLYTTKELCYRYAASYPVMKESLSRLQHEGVLMRRGSRHVVADRTVEAGNAILVIARGHSAHNEPFLLSEWTGKLLLSIEQACTNRNLQMRFFSLYFVGQRMKWSPELDRMLKGNLRSKGILGILFITQAISAEAVSTILSTLPPSSDCPVAVLDPEMEHNGVTALRKGGPAFFSICSGYDAGRKVADYLLSKGHTRIAFISASHETGWSRQRLRGVSDSVQAAGGTLVPLTRPSPPHPFSRPLSARLDRIVLQALFPGEEPHHELIKEHAISIPYFQFSAFLARSVEREAIRNLLEASATALERCTACIGVTDPAALACLDVLQKHPRLAASPVDVISFDNSMESLIWKITSYSFNEQALANALLTHLLNSSWVRRQVAHCGYITIDGYIVRRDSA